MEPAGSAPQTVMSPGGRLTLRTPDGQSPFREMADERDGMLADKTGSLRIPAAEIVRDVFRIATDHVLDFVNFDQSRHAGDTGLDGLTHARALKVVVVENDSELCSHVPAWQDLADQAIEANVFYEPWLMRPALRTLQGGRPLRLVFIYEQGSPDTAGVSRLCGFFPLEPVSRYRNLPVRAWRLWKHLHCFLCTPLIRRERARETLTALLQWAGGDGGADVLDFSHVRGDGPFHDLLIEHANESGTLQCVTNRFARALWKQGPKLEDYLQNALSTGVRKEYRRQRKRLGELGRLEFRTLREVQELDHWLEEFLGLEASGWKAREGQALGLSANHQTFVRAAVRVGFDRGQILLQGLFLDGKPVAMLLSFLAGTGA
jgi:CelD/BcsL family acetyltransferase involved in cellulose biosynthesis